MSILAWIIVGGFAGWIASLIMSTDAQQGIFMNIVIGIVGAMIGGFAFTLLGFAGLSGFSFYSLFVATIGSVILLWLRRVIA